MNKRIRELVDEAYTEVMHERGGTYMAFDKAKFAELIVQECIDICDAYGMPDGTSQTAMILSAAIKRKFGVK